MQTTHEPAGRTPRVIGLGGAEKSPVARTDYWDQAMQQAHRIGTSQDKGAAVRSWAQTVRKALGLKRK